MPLSVVALKTGLSQRRPVVTAGLLIVCLAVAGRATAVLPLLDDWPDRFAVGAWLADGAIDTRSGWPRELWSQPRWQPDRCRALAALAVLSRSHPDSLAVWRLADGDSLGWLVTGGQGDSSTVFLLAALPGHKIAAQAASLLAAGPSDSAFTDGVATLLSTGHAELPPHERFAWTLRLLAATEARGEEPDWGRLWKALLELPFPDRAAGWSVWSAVREAHRLAPFPADTLQVAATRWLATLPSGSVSWRALDVLHLPADVKAGLGASQLQGTALRRHLAMYPRPPAVPAWQRPWLLARWRQLGRTAAAARRLARLPGVASPQVAELLRRSVDLRLSRGDKEGAVADLAQALRLVGENESRIRRLVRAEVERALALARHRGWGRLRRRLEALIHWRRQPHWPPRLVNAAALVDAGQAPNCDDTTTFTVPAVAEVTWRLRLWRDWGRRLLAAGKADTRRGRLQILLSRQPDHNLALLPELATLLGNRFRDALLKAALEHDLVRVAGGALPRSPSALRAAIVHCPRTPLGVTDRFLLLGAAIILDDPAAQQAAAVSLPAAGLPPDLLLVLDHPLPAENALRNVLAGAGLDPALLLALARNESGFRPTARSASGALGWLQLMPFHHTGRGVEQDGPRWTDPVAAVTLAARLLRDASRRYAGDPYRVVAAYNAGDGAVARWCRQLGGRPDRSIFAAWIGYPETRRYTRQVLIDRQVYRWLLSSRHGVADPTSRSTPRT